MDCGKKANYYLSRRQQYSGVDGGHHWLTTITCMCSVQVYVRACIELVGHSRSQFSNLHTQRKRQLLIIYRINVSGMEIEFSSNNTPNIQLFAAAATAKHLKWSI